MSDRYRVMDDRPCSQCGAPLIWDNVCRGADCLFCLHQAFAACTCDEVQQPIPQPSAFRAQWDDPANERNIACAPCLSRGLQWCKHNAPEPIPQPSADVSRVLAAIRSELRSQPKYWVTVSDRPMQRSAPCMFEADVNRAIDAAEQKLTLSSSSSLPSDPEKIIVSGAETNQTDARNAQRPTAGNRGDSE